jgi:hypothetical protein
MMKTTCLIGLEVARSFQSSPPPLDSARGDRFGVWGDTFGVRRVGTLDTLVEQPAIANAAAGAMKCLIVTEDVHSLRVVA